jgi:uncharacterized membrane protein
MKTTALQDHQGKTSISRLIAVVVIFSALVVVFAMVFFCFIHADKAVGILGVTGGLFTTISGPTFFFLYNQKKLEK